MPIIFKSKLSSSVANQTFLDKTIDDIKKGKLTLYKVTLGEADQVDDVQVFLNELADVDGVAGEGDLAAKTYSSEQIIANGDDRKVAIGKLDAQAKDNLNAIDDLVSLSGVAKNETNLGIFSGTTIPDASDIKDALQSLESAHEEVDQNVNDLITLSGVAENSSNLGVFTGTIIPDNQTVKAAIQALETETENKISKIVSSTDDALARWDGTSGSAIQNSTATLTDAGVFTLSGQMNVDNLRIDGNTISSTNTNGNLSVSTNGTGNIVLNADVILSNNLSPVSFDNTQTGANVTLSLPTTSFIRLTGAGLASIDMITPGADEPGSRVVFTNATGGTVIFNNLTGATAANQILTGTNTNFNLLDGASIEAIYDATTQKWKLIGTSTGSEFSGPVSSTDNAVTRWDGTTGKIVQNSGVIIDDSNIMTGLAGISSSGSATFSGALNTSSTATSGVTGSSAVVTSATASVIRLTSGILSSIGGYANTTNGRRTTFINNTGNAISINNEDTAVTNVNRIITGTNGNVIIQNLGSFELIYNSTTQRHHMIAGAGSGGSVGGINYIDNYNFEGDTSGVLPVGWATYADTAGLAPVDGTGGTPNTTFLATTTTPLRGTKSAILSKNSGASRQGEGASYDFTIDSADQAQVLRISFDYNSSSDYADGEIRVYVYDVFNSRLIEVIDRDLLASTQGKFVGTFQTSPDSLSYRLIFHIADTDTLQSWTVEIGNVIVGPQTIVKGAIVTDWEDLPGVTVTNFTASSIIAKYRREGDSARVSISITSSSVLAGALQVNIPSILLIDESKITAANTWIGEAVFSDTSANISYLGRAYQTASNSQVLQFYGPDLGPWRSSTSTPVAMASGDVITVDLLIPIQGWSSNVVLSEDVGNREIVFKARGNPTTTSFTGTAPLIWASNTIFYDTTSSYDATTGIYTVPETGYYDVSATVLTAGTEALNTSYVLTIHDEILGTLGGTAERAHAAGITFVNCSFDGSFQFTKGQQISVRLNTDVGTPSIGASSAVNKFEIRKRSSPQTIAASEVVAARYNSSSGQPIGATDTTIIFENKVLDTHNAYNTTTGEYTAPQTGIYSIFTSIAASYTSSATSNRAQFLLRVNGSPILINFTRAGYVASSTWMCSISATAISLNKGDVVKITADLSVAGNLGLYPYNIFTISKINGVS